MSGIGKSFFSIHYASNGSILDNNNKELLTFNVDSGATNNLQITNNSAGSNVSIDVIGDDTDIGLNLNPKGHGKVNILGSTSNTGGIRIYGSGDNKEAANHVGLTVSSGLSEDITFTLPTKDGSSGQVLQTDGSGALSFITVSSGSSADGDANQIQYTDGAGNFQGASGITTNGTNLTLSSGDLAIQSGSLDIQSASLKFNGTTEQISRSTSDLLIEAGNNIQLSANSGSGSVVLENGTYLEFAGSSGGEDIRADSSDLTIRATNDINLSPGINVNIPANKGLTFGDDGENISGDGTDLTVTSSNILNLTPGSTSNVIITQGSLVLSSETITDVTATKAVTKCISYYDVTGGGSLTTSVEGQPVTAGQIWHILFDNADNTGTSLQVNFGSNGLASGSGLAQYITFNTHGQSASLIYIGSKWRIINTGATVS